jgi:brefeldin A-inhibited guanine nucleotide-exchange protein
MGATGEGGLELASGLSETASAWGGQEVQVTVASQLQKDAFLVFRALCKLSIRSTDSAPGSEITTIRGKVRAGLLHV